MGVFIFLIGGAYLLYKYVEEEKGMGKKGGWTAVAVAFGILTLFMVVGKANNGFDFLVQDGLIGMILVYPAIPVLLGIGGTGLFLGMNDKEFLKSLPKIMLGIYIIFVAIFAVLVTILELFFS